MDGWGVSFDRLSHRAHAGQHATHEIGDRRLTGRLWFVNEIVALWDSLPERKKAGVFALILWLIFGLITRVWEDE